MTYWCTHRSGGGFYTKLCQWDRTKTFTACFTSFQFDWHVWYLHGWGAFSFCARKMKNQNWWRCATETQDRLMCCSLFCIWLDSSWSLIEMAWHKGWVLWASDSHEVLRWELPLPLGVGIAVTWPSMGSQVSAYLGSTWTRVGNADSVRSATQKLWWTCLLC